MRTEEIYRIFREEATGVSTDSRTVMKGQIFFALWGNNYNGNIFAAEAIRKGAVCAVVDEPAYETEKTILVDDCLLELQALALLHRKEMKVPVLAITGTNGKTTTKNLIAAIMAKKIRVHSTPGNLNNEIGVPLTILSTPKDAEMMIIEMGASHIGEIRTLCEIARPDYGIITNVGTAHLEGFGSVEGVLKAKTELYEYLRKVNGVAIYNEQNHLLSGKIFRLVNRAVPYSDPTGIELKIEELPSESGLRLKATYQHEVYNINTMLFGSYNIENIRAAIAAGLFLGAEMSDIADTIGKFQPENNRSQIITTKNNTLVCDSYNANPTSMKMAVDSFSALKAGNKILILGDMLELGDKSGEEHAMLLGVVKAYGFQKVLLAGPIFDKLSHGYGFISFPDTDKLMVYLKMEQLRGNTILVKGSRGMKLERIYEFL